MWKYQLESNKKVSTAHNIQGLNETLLRFNLVLNEARVARP